MPRVLRRDAVLLIAGSSYRKKTNAVWELDDQPKKDDEGIVLYYEDIRPDLRVH